MAHPILILAYRRSEELNRVIASVQQLKPTKIYFHVHDAPTEEHQKDVEKVKEVIRGYPGAKEIKYIKEPLGVRKSLYSALGWISSKENAFLVFEDDVVLKNGGAKTVLDKMNDILGGGILKFGPDRERGVYWGWGTTSATVNKLLEKPVDEIDKEMALPHFDDIYHYLGVMELYRREAFMAWDDEIHMIAKVLGIKTVTTKKALTEHIGSVSTRTSNGIDLGFGEGSHIMFVNGKMAN